MESLTSHGFKFPDISSRYPTLPTTLNSTSVSISHKGVKKMAKRVVRIERDISKVSLATSNVQVH